MVQEYQGDTYWLLLSVTLVRTLKWPCEPYYHARESVGFFFMADSLALLQGGLQSLLMMLHQIMTLYPRVKWVQFITLNSLGESIHTSGWRRMSRLVLINSNLSLTVQVLLTKFKKYILSKIQNNLQSRKAWTHQSTCSSKLASAADASPRAIAGFMWPHTPLKAFLIAWVW